MIDYVTHYYLSDRGPLLNLSDLDPGQCERVMDGLTSERLAGRQQRRFGRTYMQMRRQTEDRLRRLFIEAGGRPDRLAPHYFVLGTSPWFRALARDMRELRLPLSALPALQTSVTYPDSFTAMAVTSEFGLPYQPRPYHRRVYLLAELPDLVAQYGVPNAPPDEDYAGYEKRAMEKYIEVQLWSDAPVRAYLLREDPQ